MPEGRREIIFFPWKSVLFFWIFDNRPPFMEEQAVVYRFLSLMWVRGKGVVKGQRGSVVNDAIKPAYPAFIMKIFCLLKILFFVLLVFLMSRCMYTPFVFLYSVSAVCFNPSV